MKTLKGILFLIAGICLMIACSKSDQLSGDDLSGNSFKNGQNEPIFDLKYSPGTILNFTGNTLYKYVQVIGNNVLADQFCPNEATITFLADNKIELSITENGGCGGRSFNAYGQITPSGATKFEYATPVLMGMNITDIIQWHLGCTIAGPGVDRGTIIFFGKFDGTTLEATSLFNSKCDIVGPNNNIFPTPVNGPVQCSWTYVLTLNE